MLAETSIIAAVFRAAKVRSDKFCITHLSLIHLLGGAMKTSTFLLSSAIPLAAVAFLSFSTAAMAQTPNSDSIDVTRSEVLQRIRDEIFFYQLSVYYLRDDHPEFQKRPMDAEHPLSTPRELRDPAIRDTSKSAIPNCDLEWFDFDVKSAKVELIHTGDNSTKGYFAVKLPIGSASAGIRGSLENSLGTDDDLTFGPGLYPASPTALEERFEQALHPSSSPHQASAASDIYPDTLKCAELRYHNYLRDLSQNSNSQGAAGTEIQNELAQCNREQPDELRRALNSDEIKMKYNIGEALSEKRAEPVTPIADRLLAWRDSLIRFARSSPVCLPPVSTSSSPDELHVKVDFKVVKDVDPSIGFDIAVISVSTDNETLDTSVNSVLFSLAPSKLQSPSTEKKPIQIAKAQRGLALASH